MKKICILLAAVLLFRLGAAAAAEGGVSVEVIKADEVGVVVLTPETPENRIREISGREALPMLIQQAYRPADALALAKTVALLDGLNAKYYRLGCNTDISAAELSFSAMKR